MTIQKETFKKATGKMNMGFELNHTDKTNSFKGEVFIELSDLDGNILHKEHKQNIITLDAGILAAILFKDPSSRNNGVNMLAVGTGATGNILSPDAPDQRQRKLNAEIARKPFTQTVFRDASGAAVGIPTNVVDFTCTFDEGEAVGPLNEMGLLSTISDNTTLKNDNPDSFPTRDLTQDLTLYDILINYLTFSVISKPSTARLTITWRITF